VTPPPPDGDNWTTTTLAEAAGDSWVAVERGGAAPGGRRRYVGMDPTRFESRRSATLPDDGAGIVPDAIVLGSRGWVLTAGGAFLSDCSWYDDPSPGEPLPPSMTDPRRLDGRCAVLASEWGGENFGHFLCDLLPRLHLLEASGHLDDVDHFLLPPISVHEARDLLARTDIDPGRIVWLELGDCVTAPEVLATTYPGERRTTPAWVPRYLRSRFADPRPALPQHGGAGPSDAPRRIYLTRGGNSRRPVDEEAVARALAGLGFVTIDSAATPGNAHFAAAEVVVGPNGAAMANTMFCPPGATVVELVPSDHEFPFFLGTSLAAGLNFVGFGCTSEGERTPGDPAPSRFDFTVDIDALLETVRDVIARGE